MLYYFFSLSCYTIVSSIVLVNRSRPIHFLFSSFWGAIDQSSLVYIYFRCFWFFISLLVWYNSYFLSYLLNSNAKGLYFLNYPCILLFPFCFVIVHIDLLCYYFHPYVLFISFVEQYFVNCHIEVSSFSFKYFHSAVCLLLVVYLPVVVLIITHIRHVIQIAAICSSYC